MLGKGPLPRRVPLLPVLSIALAASLYVLFVPAFTAFAASHPHVSLVGPKKNYLALGDSLAFGYQPDLDWNHGYADDFYANLQTHGAQSFTNMACPDESTKTFINGGCPYAVLRKTFYTGSQLSAAVNYLKAHAGQVSPVTLDIGANDVLPDINSSTCAVSSTFQSDLATMDANLKNTILPQLLAAMKVNGQVSGDLIIMNYYDPYQNLCPGEVADAQEINSHLANDAASFGLPIADTFKAFGGPTTPNPNICNFSWICSVFKDVHAQRAGYTAITTAFENIAGY